MQLKRKFFFLPFCPCLYIWKMYIYSQLPATDVFGMWRALTSATEVCTNVQLCSNMLWTVWVMEKSKKNSEQRSEIAKRASLT